MNWAAVVIFAMVFIMITPFVFYFPYAFFTIVMDMPCDGCLPWEIYGKYAVAIFCLVSTTVFCIVYVAECIDFVKKWKQ